MQHLSQLAKSLFVSFTLLIGACATQVVETPSDIQRSSIPLGEFKRIILVEAELASIYAGQSANEKAAKKINEILASETRKNLDNVEQVSLEEFKAIDLSSVESKDVLVIKPLIKQIKFIGGAARFWAGAMAGSSVVIMDTVFIDGASNEQIGITGSYRKAGAYTDVYGISSNGMLSEVSQDVGMYIAVNK